MQVMQGMKSINSNAIKVMQVMPCINCNAIKVMQVMQCINACKECEELIIMQVK